MITAGADILAADIQAALGLSVIKGSDESVTSSTALQNDNELFLAVDANTNYIFTCFLLYEGGTLGSSDLSWDWSVPTGATMRYGVTRISTSSVSNPGNLTGFTAGGVVAAGTNGAGNLLTARMEGSLLVSSTAGTLQLQWAQNSSNATATIVHAQSYLELRQPTS